MVSRGIKSAASNSLVSQFQFLATLLAMTLVGGGLVFVVLTSYRMANSEREKTIQSIGNGLARLVARPLSWGDYVGLQDTISGIRMPPFICDVEVADASGKTVASLRQFEGAAPCPKKEASVQFEVTKLGELNSGLADGTMGAVTLQIDNSDLRSRYLNVLLLSIAVGLVLLLLLLLISRVAIVRALRPLSRALDAAISNQGADDKLIAIAPVEVRPLIEKLNILYDQQAKSETKVRIGEMARQVAHDIRSPLSALNMVTGTLNGQLAEQQRVIIRAATQRINDIANGLLGPAGGASQDRKTKTEMLIPLIESVLSEKRAQYRERLELDIQSDLSHGYGLFAAMDSVEISRVLSNLINNSVESLQQGGGWIKVSAQLNGRFADIVVQDNGAGIPREVLSRVGEQGFSYGKQGSGLGIHHAMQVLKDMQGRFEIKSTPGVGTTVMLSLPLAQPPPWFVRKLMLTSRLVVSVDDDRTIHQIWATRLTAMPGSQIKHCMFSSLEEFEKWFESHGNRSMLVLIDYEFLHQQENGLKIVERLGIAQQSVLVTSRYDDQAVRQKAEELHLGILPKTLAAYIPIELTAGIESEEILTSP
jgi:signal transduction histidine kinase